MIDAKLNAWLRRLLGHFENRLSEVGTALMMLGLSLELSLWPDAIGASAFHRLLEVLPPAWLGWGFSSLARRARLRCSPMAAGPSGVRCCALPGRCRAR